MRHELRRFLSFTLIATTLSACLYVGLAILSLFFKIKPIPQRADYSLLISSGAIHTEFVFELENSPYDWFELFPPSLVHEGTPRAPKFISIGQGDKRFYYEFLEMSDLTLGLAFNGAFLPTPTAIHVEYLDRLNPSLRHYKLPINRENYLKLVAYILESIRLEDGRPIKIDDFNYFRRDAFFWGTQSYHLFNTCNMWTARGLEVASLPRPYWAPFRYSIDNALNER